MPEPKTHPVSFPPGLSNMKVPVLTAVLFLLACWQFLGAVDNRPMHRDEARWIHRAVYVRELLHPLGPYWDESTWIERGGTLDERYRLRAQPPMGSYVMGIGFLLQGKSIPDIGFWNMDQDDAWNADHGNQPSRDQVLTARRTSAIVGAITVAAVFLIANRLMNPLGGVVAGTMLAFNPLMIYLATFAGSDAVLALTVALSAVAAYRLADRPTWPRAILLGVVLGLGGATKLSPLGITTPLALLGTIVLGYHLIRSRLNSRTRPSLPSRQLGVQLLSTPAVALLTFILIYPYLWRDPIGHIRAIIDYRQWGMEIQGELWQQIAVDSRTEALRRVGIKLGDEWTTFGRLGWPWLPSGTELAIACAGMVLLVWLVIRHGLWSAHALAAAVLTGEAAITVYGLNADWARYHLPILLLTTVCIGVAVGGAGESLLKLVTGTILAPPAMPDDHRDNAHARRFTMEANEIQDLLRGYLNEIDWSGGATKEDIMLHVTERDNDLRALVSEYIPEGKYQNVDHVMTLIPEQAWQDSQGDTWRGAETQYPKDVETNFKGSPVAKTEREAGLVGRSEGTSSTSSGDSNRKNSGKQSHGGHPGDGAGRKENAGSQTAGVFPASGPLPDDPDARYQDMASFGQGERGAAGYEDSGQSEVRTVPPDDTSNQKSKDSGGSKGNTSS